MSDAALTDWLTTTLGNRPRDAPLFARAMTHGSHGEENYERLEFLGDRVLGLVVAALLYRRFPREPEGRLSMRFNALVSREACAAIGRAIGVPAMLILGKQARDDGAQASDNVIGDAVEALIGALFLEVGFDAARAFIERAWAGQIETVDEAPRHPKSALQEWAAAHRCKPPIYKLAGRHGPHHAPRFSVTVDVAGRGGGSATAEGASKQEAETAAAATLLERLEKA